MLVAIFGGAPLSALDAVEAQRPALAPATWRGSNDDHRDPKARPCAGLPDPVDRALVVCPSGTVVANVACETPVHRTRHGARLGGHGMTTTEAQQTLNALASGLAADRDGINRLLARLAVHGERETLRDAIAQVGAWAVLTDSDAPLAQAIDAWHRERGGRAC